MQRIPESEQAVLEVLFEEAPLSASQVAERIGPARGWSLQTVKTLLSRLVGRHAVDYDIDGRTFRYKPIIRRDDLAAAQARTLIDRLFDGRAAPLVAHLAERGELSPDDIAEIEAILARLKP